MDGKEQLLVGDLYQRVRTHTFHERDVLALLICYGGIPSLARQLRNSATSSHIEKKIGAR
jgi:hypothetical protein